MKLEFQCFQCLNEKQVTSNNYQFEIRDDNIYLIECEKGHESIIFFELQKFEILFEMGIKAMLDGYFREAVSNFAASIERFYEFSIEVFISKLFNNEVNKYNTWITSHTEVYNASWKMISNQSERQLGAYVMLYLATYKEPPELIKPKKVEFRNKVIHKGYFPTEQETLEYAEYIFSYLHCKTSELNEKMKDNFSLIYDKKITDYISNEDVNGKYCVTWRNGMGLQTLCPFDEKNRLKFNDLLEERKTNGYELFKK